VKGSVLRIYAAVDATDAAARKLIHRLIERRLALGLSHPDMAALTRTQIDIETSRHYPVLHTLIRYANALGLKLDFVG
jgi:hypothetical protein